MAKRIDLVGDTYGDFTVIEMLYGYKYVNNKPRTYCKCIDNNGDEYIIRSDALRSGATKYIKGVGKKSCAKDIEGMQFGHLTALYPTNNKASNGCIIWHCICDCGKEVDVSVGQLIRGHTRSCGHRHRSKYEEYIHEYLISINAVFETEYRFDNCRNSNGTDTLPFDFYFPNLNKAIEFDGQHHFMPVIGWGGQDKYNTILENDKIKTNYCLENNIELLRIPYFATNEEIKNMIDSFLSPVTITAA